LGKPLVHGRDELDPDEYAELNERVHQQLVAINEADLPQSSEFKTAYEQLRIVERKFVDQYLIAGDAISAYLQSWPQAGVSARAIRVRVKDLMSRPLVQASIKERQRELSRASMISAERVIEEVAKVAFSNLGDFLHVTADGDPMLTLANATRDQLATLSEVTVEDYTDGRGDDARDVKRIKLKQHDKMRGLDALMRHFGLHAPERLEVSGRGGGPIQTQNLHVNATVEEAAELYANSLREYD